MRCKPTLPQAAEPLISSFSVAFSPQTFQRFVVLLVGAALSLGRRTVTACLWAARSIARGDPSSYHRFFSHAAWSPWPLGKALAAAILELAPAGPVVVTVDDTVALHKGKRVYGKGRHHDACRSTHSHMVWKWGHKWVVLAVHVTFPFCSRAWALPVLAALYRPPIWTSRRSGGTRPPRSWPGNWRRCWCGGSPGGSLSCWATGVTPATNWRLSVATANT